MTRVSLVVLLFGIAFSAAMAALTPAAPAPQSGSGRDPFPEATGKTALLKVCGNCHAAETVIQTLRTRPEWSEVIDQMARFGADASDQEFDQILAYLAKHFSPIKVNTAAAMDLEGLLDVPANVAQAIVDYRQDKGEFKTIDDLKKVQGLEGGKLEALKTRIVF